MTDSPNEREKAFEGLRRMARTRGDAWSVAQMHALAILRLLYDLDAQEAEIATLKATDDMRYGQLEASRSMLTTQEQRLKAAVEALEYSKEAFGLLLDERPARRGKGALYSRCNTAMHMIAAALVEARGGEG